MILNLNHTEVGIILSALNEAGGNFHPMPFRTTGTEESKKDCKRLFDRINKLSKKEIFS